MKLIIHNEFDEIPQLAEQVEKFLAEQGAPAKAVVTTNLCLEELLTNTIKYGYSDDGRHEIYADIRLSNRELIIELVDDAAPFDPTKEGQTPNINASIEERRIGGLGIHLVTKFTDSMHYTRQQHRNRLTLRKRLDRDT